MEIRAMTAADDRMSISRVYERSWKFAYRGIIPQDYLDSIPEGRWAPNLDREGWSTLVCVDGGEIVGTSSFCASRFDEFPGWGEIGSLYLLPEQIGKGRGRALMDAALAAQKAQGYKKVFLWVLEENARARKFYERYGFSAAGDVLDSYIGGKALREVRYVFENR